MWYLISLKQGKLSYNIKLQTLGGTIHTDIFSSSNAKAL